MPPHLPVRLPSTPSPALQFTACPLSITELPDCLLPQHFDLVVRLQWPLGSPIWTSLLSLPYTYRLHFPQSEMSESCIWVLYTFLSYLFCLSLLKFQNSKSTCVDLTNSKFQQLFLGLLNRNFSSLSPDKCLPGKSVWFLSTKHQVIPIRALKRTLSEESAFLILHYSFQEFLFCSLKTWCVEVPHITFASFRCTWNNVIGGL